MQGTLINAGAIILGSVIGLLIHSKLPKKLTSITFQAIGLFAIFLGIVMATKSNNLIIMIFSIVGGRLLEKLLI